MFLNTGFESCSNFFCAVKVEFVSKMYSFLNIPNSFCSQSTQIICEFIKSSSTIKMIQFRARREYSLNKKLIPKPVSLLTVNIVTKQLVNKCLFKHNRQLRARSTSFPYLFSQQFQQIDKISLVSITNLFHKPQY